MSGGMVVFGVPIRLLCVVTGGADLLYTMYMASQILMCGALKAHNSGTLIKVSSVLLASRPSSFAG